MTMLHLAAPVRAVLAHPGDYHPEVLAETKTALQGELHETQQRSAALRAQLVSSYADEEELKRAIRKINDKLRASRKEKAA